MIALMSLGPLLPHLSEIIAAIVFAILLTIIIAKFVTPRFEATYAARADAIAGGIKRAEAAQAEAQAAHEKYTAELTQLRTEAAQVREDAKTQGAQILAELREQANQESARIIENARSQMAAERAQVLEQLRTEVGGLATTLAGRIVGESLDDDERASRVVERFIASLEDDEATGDSTGGGSAAQQPTEPSHS